MTGLAQTSAPQLDVDAIRADFPILQTQVHGRPLVYLDSAATSQKPRSVIDAITNFYCTTNANVHRSPHWLGQQATEQYEGARARMARAVNAWAPESVVWVRGTTEAINLAATALGAKSLNADDTILLTEMEHHSNLVPWQILAKRMDLKLRFVPVTDEGRLDLEAAQTLLAEGPKVFAFTAKSNVLGTESPVATLCGWARDAGAISVVDGAQALPHGAVDVQALGCDLFACSAHKGLGPMGIGALIVRPETYDRMGVYQGGGEMIRRVRLEESSFAEPPLRYEAGTPSVADVVGFHAALDYLEAVGPDKIHAHETRLTRLCLDLLHERGIRTFGPDDASERAGVVSFAVPDVHPRSAMPYVHPHEVAQYLDGLGIAVRAGHHCAQPLMKRMGVMATARASFYLYNTEQEVRQLADGIVQTQEYFGR